ncbi:hypothetical protein GCM10010230_56150 [Streptomyces narbonensis]|nr:hypothetical protein GCM10010230_56150 [Streptomyces narbonensis]
MAIRQGVEPASWNYRAHGAACRLEIVWQRLTERVVGLVDAAVLLPGFNRASPAG